jgi:cellulose synthase/poly-beta-1,6-N-acetylglucosamine synthase-like glycosyltransferase
MWELLFQITAVFLAVYAMLILLYRHWFMSFEQFDPSKIETPQTFFSIIIPARNEEANIGECLLSILKQSYPSELYELILINDHSTDATVSIVEKLQLKYTHLKLMHLADHLQDPLNSYKKKAIELAIGQSNGSWIITTDADTNQCPSICGGTCAVQK